MPFKADRLAKIKTNLEAHVAEGRPVGLVALVSRGDETRVLPVGTMAIGPVPAMRSFASPG